MLKFLKEILNQSTAITDSAMIKSDKDEIQKLQIATCAIFLEAAHSDDEFLDEEKEKIISVMKNTFQLDESSVHNLIELSEEKRSEAVSYYEYTDIINNSFSNEEKYEILRNLWRLILIDDVIDSHEDHFIRKMTGNLKMEHSDMIATKMEVKREMGHQR